MNDPVIQIRGLSKRYRLGGMRAMDRTFRELIVQSGAALLRRRRRQATAQTAAARREFWALRDVNLDVNQGEVVGIVGANGAGKSTLLKILSRITDPTEGAATIRGRVAALLEVGTGFHPELTGRENIYLNGTILGMRKREIDARFDAIVDFSGVEPFLDTPVKRYSSGMTVRLAFAVAAHLEPQILIVDEVLAVGDAAFQQRCLGRMKELAAGGGRTVLFVSHNLAAVQQLCDRALLLQAGRVVADGAPTQIVNRYLNMALGDCGCIGGDVAALPRSAGMAGDVRFQSWRLLSADGQPTARLRFGEPITLDLTMTATGRVENAVLDLSLHTAEGTMIALLSTEHSPRELTMMPGQTASVRMRVDDLRLTPGTYYLAMVMRTMLTSLDHLPTAGAIEVTQELYDPAIRPGYHRCLVHVSPRWDVRLDGCTALEERRAA